MSFDNTDNVEDRVVDAPSALVRSRLKSEGITRVSADLTIETFQPIKFLRNDGAGGGNKGDIGGSKAIGKDISAIVAPTIDTMRDRGKFEGGGGGGGGGGGKSNGANDNRSTALEESVYTYSLLTIQTTESVASHEDRTELSSTLDAKYQAELTYHRRKRCILQYTNLLFMLRFTI